MKWVVSNWEHINFLTFDYFVLLLLLFILLYVRFTDVSMKGNQGRQNPKKK